MNSFEEIIIYELCDFCSCSCLGRHFSFALLRFMTIRASAQLIFCAAFQKICDFKLYSTASYFQVLVYIVALCQLQ